MHQVHGSRRRARDIQFEQLSGLQCAGDCTAPVQVRYRGAPDRLMVGLGLEKDQVAVAYVAGRCRKCQACLDHRRRLWTARAIDECAVSTRSWFGTLTVAPEHRVRFMYSAQLRNSRGCGDSWDTLDTSEQFRKIADEFRPELTNFLKRVRKNSGTSFRYLLVTEVHEDGFPHFHMLLHEGEEPVRKRVLDAGWRVGFSQFRLLPDADPRGARYACKYLSKSALTRVRASQRYGQEGRLACLWAERLEGVSRAVQTATETEPSGERVAGFLGTRVSESEM